MSNNSTDEQFKVCPKCKENKPYSAYGVDNGKSRGIKDVCRLCTNKTRRESYQKNPTDRSKKKYLDWSHLDIETTFKECGCCKENKPLKDYAPNKGGKFGRHSKCKECVNAMHHEKREERLEARRKAREENREHYLNYSREYYKKHPEIFKNNTKRARKEGRDWRSKNPERNRITANAYAKKWRAKNPYITKMRDVARKIRRREKANVSRDDVSTIWKSQKGRCWYCGVKLKLDNTSHLDHVVPLSRGGTSELHNLRWVCQPCNQSKHAKSAIEFAGRLF